MARPGPSLAPYLTPYNDGSESWDNLNRAAETIMRRRQMSQQQAQFEAAQALQREQDAEAARQFEETQAGIQGRWQGDDSWRREEATAKSRSAWEARDALLRNEVADAEASNDHQRAAHARAQLQAHEASQPPSFGGGVPGPYDPPAAPQERPGSMLGGFGQAPPAQAPVQPPAAQQQTAPTSPMDPWAPPAQGPTSPAGTPLELGPQAEVPEASVDDALTTFDAVYGTRGIGGMSPTELLKDTNEPAPLTRSSAQDPYAPQAAAPMAPQQPQLQGSLRAPEATAQIEGTLSGFAMNADDARIARMITESAKSWSGTVEKVQEDMRKMFDAYRRGELTAENAQLMAGMRAQSREHGQQMDIGAVVDKQVQNFFAQNRLAAGIITSQRNLDTAEALYNSENGLADHMTLRSSLKSVEGRGVTDADARDAASSMGEYTKAMNFIEGFTGDGRMSPEYRAAVGLVIKVQREALQNAREEAGLQLMLHMRKRLRAFVPGITEEQIRSAQDIAFLDVTGRDYQEYMRERREREQGSVTPTSGAPAPSAPAAPQPGGIKGKPESADSLQYRQGLPSDPNGNGPVENLGTGIPAPRVDQAAIDEIDRKLGGI